MLHRIDFKEKTYWEAECPDCHCAIDLYKRPEKVMSVKCSSCGMQHNFKPVLRLLKNEDNL